MGAGAAMKRTSCLLGTFNTFVLVLDLGQDRDDRHVGILQGVPYLGQEALATISGPCPDLSPRLSKI